MLMGSVLWISFVYDFLPDCSMLCLALNGSCISNSASYPRHALCAEKKQTSSIYLYIAVYACSPSFCLCCAGNLLLLHNSIPFPISSHDTPSGTSFIVSPSLSVSLFLGSSSKNSISSNRIPVRFCRASKCLILLPGYISSPPSNTSIETFFFPAAFLLLPSSSANDAVGGMWMPLSSSRAKAGALVRDATPSLILLGWLRYGRTARISGTSL